MMSTLQNVAFIGGHIDDVLIGCYGLLKQFKGNHYLISTTDNLPFGEETDLDIVERTRREIKSLISACDVEYYEILAKDGRSFESISLIKNSLESFMHYAKPAVIVFPHYEGGHIDHDIASFLSSSIAEKMDIPSFEYSLYNFKDGRINHHEFVEGKSEKIMLSRNDMHEKVELLRILDSKKKDINHFIGENFEAWRAFTYVNYNVRPHSGILMYERKGLNTYNTFKESIQKVRT